MSKSKKYKDLYIADRYVHRKTEIANQFRILGMIFFVFSILIQLVITYVLKIDYPYIITGTLIGIGFMFIGNITQKIAATRAENYKKYKQRKKYDLHH